ncbi:MAG: sulfurtransferase [Anaerolineae bacterium]|nr:MAG: sulfurtransferase [Anaerolineae bacterium]
MAYRTLITPQTLYLHHQDDDWVVVDCRFWLDDTGKGRRDYLRAHIPGAVYAHLDEDLSAPVEPGVTGRHPLPAVSELAERLGRWGIGPEVQVVAYDDRGGAIAARLWWLLRYLGHDDVAVLDGGWPAWVEAGYPVDDVIPSPAPRTFEPHPRPEMLATAEDVLARMGDPAFRLVDSRAPERYRGEQEPLDPVAGHIPGALNYHFERNLTPQGGFEDAAVLRARFQALLGDTPPERVIFYCGSGVTAAHNVLAVTHAGLGTPRLYAGSWSHWITDPERPVVREA